MLTLPNTGGEALLEGSTNGETVTVAQAAQLLGVHKNTVRHRIKVGVLPAHKTLTAYGEAYMIPRESLDLPVQDPSNPLQGDWSQNPSNPSNAQESHELTTVQQRELMQALLDPFVRELGGVREELGKIKAERDAALRRVTELETVQVDPDPPERCSDQAAASGAAGPASRACAPGASQGARVRSATLDYSPLMSSLTSTWSMIWMSFGKAVVSRIIAPRHSS
jgi:excisionase family DNA binding protein